MGGWTKGREEVSDAVRQREGENEIEGESIGEVGGERWWSRRTEERRRGRVAKHS